MRRDHLHDVQDATEVLTLHREAMNRAEEKWRRAIRDAVKAGESVTAIAEAAGITRARVYQIRDDRR